jgi:predicted DNA-binding protein (MmcQ/YjbR family)
MDSDGRDLDVVGIAWEMALGLDRITREQPFGPNYDVAKICGKVFMMSTDVRGKPVVTLKCDPDYASALRGAHPSIVRGYHMNKTHWISIAAGPDVTDALVEDLVLGAYHLVRSRLPKAVRTGYGWE